MKKISLSKRIFFTIAVIFILLIIDSGFHSHANRLAITAGAFRVSDALSTGIPLFIVVGVIFIWAWCKKSKPNKPE